ncbi:MAG: SIS domain-containing protein [Chloroflexi bacterium]|nr:MAG: SIS domain-containing protein [Chloroflexota bacterium]
MGLRAEIGEQPEVARRLLASRDEIKKAAKAIAAAGVKYAVVAARGTSDNAAVYAQYLFAIRHRLAVALALPSATSIYGTTPDLRSALVIGISQSGRSPDIVGVISEARRQGALTLAVSNAPGSDLVAAAELSIGLHAGRERAVAASKTYTGELLALALLSTELNGNGANDVQALAELPRLMREALAEEEVAARLAAADAELSRCVVLGRGYHYATAREWALKLKELALVHADPYSFADFEHGPVGLIDPGFRVLAVVPSGVTRGPMLRAINRNRKLGASTLSVTDDAGASRGGAWLPHPRTAEWLAPIVSIIPCQLYALHLSLAKNLNPDRPRTVRKITMTR